MAAVEVRLDHAASKAVAAEWGAERSDLVDEGLSVPLLMGSLPEVPLVACSMRDWTGRAAGSDRIDPQGSLDRAEALAEAIRSLATESHVLVVASAHSSAALSPRAPLTERAEGLALDRQILAALGSDAGELSSIPPRAWADAGSCGAGPLAVLGHLFGGRSAEVLAYEAPVGVGYLVATL